MKKMITPLVLCLLLTCPHAMSQNGLAQNLPTSGGEVVFTEVKELKEKQIDLHMEKMEQWFQLNQLDFEKIQESDNTRDKARGRGSIEVLWGPNNFEQYFKTVKFEVFVVVKKDRYMYRFDNFIVQDQTSESQLEVYQSDTKHGEKYNPMFYKEIDDKINVLIESLASALADESS